MFWRQVDTRVRNSSLCRYRFRSRKKYMIIDSRKQMKPCKTTQTKKRLEDRNLRNLADKGLKEKGSQRVG